VKRKRIFRTIAGENGTPKLDTDLLQTADELVNVSTEAQGWSRPTWA